MEANSTGQLPLIENKLFVSQASLEKASKKLYSEELSKKYLALLTDANKLKLQILDTIALAQNTEVEKAPVTDD